MVPVSKPGPRHSACPPSAAIGTCHSPPSLRTVRFLQIFSSTLTSFSSFPSLLHFSKTHHFFCLFDVLQGFISDASCTEHGKIISFSLNKVKLPTILSLSVSLRFFQLQVTFSQPVHSSDVSKLCILRYSTRSHPCKAIKAF